MMSTIAKGEINSVVNAALLKVAVIEVVTDAKREVVAAKTGLRGNFMFNGRINHLIILELHIIEFASRSQPQSFEPPKIPVQVPKPTKRSVAIIMR